jgi:WD40 repeat protein
LAKVAEQFYKSITPNEQAMMRRLMLRLVRVERGQDVAIKRVRRDALLQSISPRVLAEQVLGRLVFERLVRVMLGDTTADDQIELVHEALARNWPRLIDWLETERSALETRRRLDARATEWIHLGRGTAGLLDAIQLGEAESWLASSEAKHLGYDEALPALVAASRAAIEEAQQSAIRQAQELAEAERQRAEAQTLRAEAQTLRAEEQAREKRRLGWAFIAIAVMCGIAIILAGYALQQANYAIRQETAARNESQTRVVQAVELQTAEVQANRSAEEARQKAELARQSEQAAQAARATAEVARTSSETARAEAERRQREAHAGELAALALAHTTHPQIALLLAAGSLQVSLRSGDTPLPVAVNTLQTLLLQITGKGYYSNSGPLSAVAFGNAGQTLATAGADGRVLLWNPADLNAAPTVLDTGGPILAMNFSSNGRYLVTTGKDGASPRLWDLSNTGSPARTLNVPATITALASSSTGQRIAIATASGSAWVWDATTTASARELRTTSPVLSIAVSTDGRWVLSGHQDGNARLWDLTDRDPIKPITTSNRRPALTKVAFSQNGRWALISASNGTTHLWQFNANGFTSGPYVLNGQTDTITAIAISSDSTRAATASNDGSTYIWRLEAVNDPTPLAVVRGDFGAVNDALITQDGQKLITAGKLGSIFVWDLSSKNPGGSARKLMGHDGPVTAIALNGQILVSVSTDASLRLWDLNKSQPTETSLPNDPTELTKLACTVAGRDLTEQEWKDAGISTPYQAICTEP